MKHQHNEKEVMTMIPTHMAKRDIGCHISKMATVCLIFLAALNSALKGATVRVGAILLLCCLSARATTYIATTGNSADVQTMINGMASGDIGLIPPGVWNWTNGVSTSRDIQILAQVPYQTTILDYAPSDIKGCMVQFNTTNTATNVYRLGGGITFNTGINRGTSNPFVNGLVAFLGTGTNCLVDYVNFGSTAADYTSDTGVYWYGYTMGVEYAVSNYMHGTCHAAFTEWPGSPTNANGYGDYSWNTPAPPGTLQAVFLENCLFSGLNGSGFIFAATDGLTGCRRVCRYSTFINANWNNHGFESGGDRDGCRSDEVYSNLFANTYGIAESINSRGGTGWIWGNTCKSNVNTVVALTSYRRLNPYNILGMADGQNTLDVNSNGGPFLTFTVTATGTTITDSGASWTAGQWKGYTAQDAAYPGIQGYIQNNASTTMTVGTPENGPLPTWTNGHTINLYLCTECCEGIGAGIFTAWPPRNASTGNPVLPWGNTYTNAIEPVYIWSNSIGGMTLLSSLFADTMGVYINTNGSPYTPAPYPHPLVTKYVTPVVAAFAPIIIGANNGQVFQGANNGQIIRGY